jgi:hypothetical protein
MTPIPAVTAVAASARDVLNGPDTASHADQHVVAGPDAGHRPGGPSAKTSHRAGSPNHQNDSKESPILGRPELNSPGRTSACGHAIDGGSR